MNSPKLQTRSSGSEPPAIAVIGCGAIARTFHLPALVAQPGVADRLILVDPDLERARAMAKEFGVKRVTDDYRTILPEVQGAVILTPHSLHYRIALDCIRAGVAVLSEKPLAESVAEVRSLIAESSAKGVPLAVNNTRRLIPACGKIAQLVREGAIGRLREIDICEGDKFDWPSASGAAFGLRGGGRGVLLDVGAHVVDLACWWVGATPRLVAYQDDSQGGSEAVAHAHMEHGGCTVNVRLSWLSKLRNTYIIRGDQGTIEAGIYDWRSVVLTTSSGTRRTITAEQDLRSYTDLAKPLAANFLQAIRGAEAPLVSATDVLPSIELIEECYARRTRFAMPWEETLNRVLPAYA